MENWKTEESVDSLEIQLKPRRSLLLLVICILTWVWTGLVFIFNTLLLTSSPGSTFLAFTGVFGDVWFLLDYFLFPILCILGAIFMFRLKKWGFWIYCLGQIPPIIYSIYVMLGLTKSLGPGLFFGLLQNVISIAFVVMYAVEMKKLSRKKISTDF